MPSHCDCGDTVSVAKRGPQEEQTCRDKMKHSAENFVKRQLEVISSHIGGKQKNFRQKISHPSDGKREEKHSKECPEEVNKTRCSGFTTHDQSFLPKEDIMAIIEELQEKTVHSLCRQRCLSPVSLKGKNSQTEKSPDIDCLTRVIDLQTSANVKKMKTSKSMKRSHGETHSDYDDLYDRKIVSPKWTGKAHQRRMYFQKEKSLEKKLDHNSLSRYQSRSSSKLSCEDRALVEDDDASSESTNSYQELHSCTPSHRASGGIKKSKKRGLTEEEHVCKRLKKFRIREADQSLGKKLLSVRARDRQICPEKMAKSFHTHEAEQSSKVDRGTKQDNKRKGSRDVEMKEKKHCSKAVNVSPRKLLMKFLHHSDVEDMADSSQPPGAGSVDTANKESLPKSKKKATENSSSEKCTAQHSVYPSSKCEKSIAQAFLCGLVLLSLSTDLTNGGTVQGE